MSDKQRIALLLHFLLDINPAFANAFKVSHHIEYHDNHWWTATMISYILMNLWAIFGQRRGFKESPPPKNK